MEVNWSESALESYSNILDYIQIYFTESTAQRAALKLREYIDKLRYFPNLGKLIFDTSKIGMIRCVFHKQNHIYYQITDKIEILLIWDGRQNPQRLKSQLDLFAK